MVIPVMFQPTVSFKDVAVTFTWVEWGHLDLPQRTVYREVALETCSRLVSLVKAVATHPRPRTWLISGMPGLAQKVLEVGPFEMQVWVLLLIPPSGQVCGLWFRVWGVYLGGWGPLLVHPHLTPGVRARPVSQQKTKPSVVPPLTRTSALKTKCDLLAGARGGPMESGAGTSPR